MRISLSPTALCALTSGAAIDATAGSLSHHASRGGRHPRGLYNHATSRLCERITRYATDVEALLRLDYEGISKPGSGNDSWAATSDALEALTYAAAEYDDDLKAIVSNYFATKEEAGRDERAKFFRSTIRGAANLLNLMANKAKHEHARARLYTAEISFPYQPISLHGFFLEGITEDGAIGPHPVVHAVQPVYSLPSLAWIAIHMIVETDKALTHFLSCLSRTESPKADTSCSNFQKAVSASARLPAYSFGETFYEYRLIDTDRSETPLDSGLTGSLLTEWPPGWFKVIGARVSYIGDGASVKYTTPPVAKVKLIRYPVPRR